MDDTMRRLFKNIVHLIDRLGHWYMYGNDLDKCEVCKYVPPTGGSNQ